MEPESEWKRRWESSEGGELSDMDDDDDSDGGLFLCEDGDQVTPEDEEESSSLTKRYSTWPMRRRDSK